MNTQGSSMDPEQDTSIQPLAKNKHTYEDSVQDRTL